MLYYFQLQNWTMMAMWAKLEHSSFLQKASALPKNGSIRGLTMRNWIQIKGPWRPLIFCVLASCIWKKTLFSLLFWCSEEHAFSASSEFRRDFRWVARPHSLITRSKTPAELHAAPRGIKPPPAVASSGPTCQDTINSYCWQIWTVPMVQLSSLTLIFCPYLHNVNLVCNGL